MKTMEERLNELFVNPEFLEKNADRGTVDEIFEAVSAEIPEITKKELEDYLVAVSKTMSPDEISENDLDSVAGGISFLGACAAIYGVGCALSVCYKGGKAIGQGIYYLTHRG